MPRAASLAEEIVKEFQIEPELIRSSGGVFEVTLNDQLVFSKKALGRHAEPGEVLGILKKKIG